MPIITTWNDKTSINPVPSGYSYCIECNFNLLTNRARLVYGVWRSEADANAGLQPIDTPAFDVDPEAFGTLISENEEAFYLVGTACDEYVGNKPRFSQGRKVPINRRAANVQSK